MNNPNLANGSKQDTEDDTTHWRKSSRSSFQGNCVEVATIDASVLVRDSKIIGPFVQFSANCWMAFVNTVKQESL